MPAEPVHRPPGERQGHRCLVHRIGGFARRASAHHVTELVVWSLSTAPQPTDGVKLTCLGVACRGTSTPISNRFTTLNAMPARKAGA